LVTVERVLLQALLQVCCLAGPLVAAPAAAAAPAALVSCMWHSRRALASGLLLLCQGTS